MSRETRSRLVTSTVAREIAGVSDRKLLDLTANGRVRFERRDGVVFYGNRHAKGTHLGVRIGVEKGPTRIAALVCLSLFSGLIQQGRKDAYGGRLRQDSFGSSGWHEHS